MLASRMRRVLDRLPLPGVPAEQSTGLREEFLADGVRGLAAELLSQPDSCAEHQKTKVDVVTQIVNDALRRRP